MSSDSSVLLLLFCFVGKQVNKKIGAKLPKTLTSVLIMAIMFLLHRLAPSMVPVYAVKTLQAYFYYTILTAYGVTPLPTNGPRLWNLLCTGFLGHFA